MWYPHHMNVLLSNKGQLMLKLYQVQSFLEKLPAKIAHTIIAAIGGGLTGFGLGQIGLIGGHTTSDNAIGLTLGLALLFGYGQFWRAIYRPYENGSFRAEDLIATFVRWSFYPLRTAVVGGVIGWVLELVSPAPTSNNWLIIAPKFAPLWLAMAVVFTIFIGFFIGLMKERIIFFRMP